MTETMEPESNEVDPRMQGAVIAASEVDAWFVREILPLEAALMQFLQHNWRNKSDIADLRQDIYIQVYESALKGLPESSRAFLFTVARHLLIRRMRREQIVPFEAVSDFDALGAAIETPGPENSVIARDDRCTRSRLEHRIAEQVEPTFVPRCIAARRVAGPRGCLGGGVCRGRDGARTRTGRRAAGAGMGARQGNGFGHGVG